MKQLPPGTPEPAPEMLEPASVVFTPTADQVPLNDHFQWWSYVKGADWQHPHGLDEPLKDEAPRANTWQGTFPTKDISKDGHAGTSPVKTFEKNGYGLYDMAGNVWEWCWDLHHANLYQSRAGTELTVNPRGPD